MMDSLQHYEINNIWLTDGKKDSIIDPMKLGEWKESPTTNGFLFNIGKAREAVFASFKSKTLRLFKYRWPDTDPQRSARSEPYLASSNRQDWAIPF